MGTVYAVQKVPQSQYPFLNDWIAAIGPGPCQIEIDDDWLLSSDLTIPDNIDIAKIEYPFTIGGPFTVTIRRMSARPKHRCFGDTTGVILPNGSEVDPVWFGAPDNGIKYGWVFDGLLSVPASTDHVIKLPKGGCLVDSGYNLADALNFQEAVTSWTHHVGLTSTAVEMPDGTFLVITREADNHGDAPDDAIQQYTMKHGGRFNMPTPDTTVCREEGVDNRDFCFGYMGNGRIGMMISRQFNPDLYPAFAYSDDSGKSWIFNQLDGSGGDTKGFTNQFSMTSYPASVGGDDNLGYAVFGGIDPNYPDLLCLKTRDNGKTWIKETAIPNLAGIPNEPSVAWIGNNDFWAMAIRRDGGVGLPVMFSTSKDLASWSQPVEGEFRMGKNPPYLFYYEGYVYFFCSMRENQAIQQNDPRGNKLLYARSPAYKILQNDFSDFAMPKCLMTFEYLLGYLSLNVSPISGKVYGTIAYDQKSEPLASDSILRSSLCIVSNEKTIIPKADPINTCDFVSKGDGTAWKIIQANQSGLLTAYSDRIKVPKADATSFQAEVRFPVAFWDAMLNITTQLRDFSPGSEADGTAVVNNIGQIRAIPTLNGDNTCASCMITVFLNDQTKVIGDGGYVVIGIMVQGDYESDEQSEGPYS